MTATQIAPSIDRLRAGAAVVALSATFGVGLLAGLNLPRTTGAGVAAVAPVAAVAITHTSADAQNAAANQTFRQGERADQVATGSAAAYQAFRQGERAGLDVPSAAASNQAFRQGERADQVATGSAAAYQVFRQGERADLGR